MRFRPNMRVFKFGTANCSTEEHYFLCFKSKEASNNCSGTQGSSAPGGAPRRKRAIASMYEHFHKLYRVTIQVVTNLLLKSKQKFCFDIRSLN